MDFLKDELYGWFLFIGGFATLFIGLVITDIIPETIDRVFRRKS